MEVNRHKQCCDPFKQHKQRKTQGLREVSAAAISSFPSLHLQLGDRVCTQCRKRIYSLPAEETESEPGEGEMSACDTSDDEQDDKARKNHCFMLDSKSGWHSWK